MKITNVSDASAGPIKILVYGASGVGKTTLAGTVKEPMLIVSAEAGLLCLAGKKIDVVDISLDDAGKTIPQEKRIARLLEVYTYLQTEEARKRYKVVFIDSLSEINSNMLAGLELEFPDRKDALPKFGELSKRMRSLIKSFRDLPSMSVIFTALSEVEKDEAGMRFIGPQLVGKLSTQVAAFFDEVFFLRIDKEAGKRVLVTEGSDNITAKDRSGKLSKSEVADLSVVFAKIRAVAAPVAAVSAPTQGNKQ